MPTASERLVWVLAMAHHAGVRHAARKDRRSDLLENYLPLMRAAMYAKGIEIYCAPTADARDSWIASARHIAVEGRCFVLSCFPATSSICGATFRLITIQYLVPIRIQF